VQAELAAYLQALRSGQGRDRTDQSDLPDPPDHSLPLTTALIVPKEKIAANGDYNLSGERYREGPIRTANFPLVPIGNICDLLNGRAFKPEDWEKADSGGIPIVRIQNLNNPDSDFNYFTGEVSERNTIHNGELLFSWSGSRGTSFGAHIWRGQKAVLNQHIFKVGFDESRATKMYLLHALNKAVTEVEENLHGGVGLVHITKGNLEKIHIPLPPLEVQKEIVAEIEGYQKVINGARAVLDHYRPHIPIHPDWPMVELGEIADVKLGKMLDQNKHRAGKLLPYARNVSVRWGVIDTHDLPEMYFEDDELGRFGLVAGDVLVCEGGEPGRAAVWNGSIQNMKYQKALHRVRFKVPFEPSMLVYLLQEMAVSGALVGWLSGTTIKHLTLESFNKLPIPLPPLATQQGIVAEIEAEQALVAANRELITRFEQKIQATLARIWGEEAPVTPEA